MNRDDWGFLFIAICAGVLMLLSSMHVRADVWITTGIHSYHTDRSQNFRENNAGLGLEYEMSQDNSIVFGEYMNSLNRRSYYTGYTIQPIHKGKFKFGIMPAIVSGYSTPSGYVIAPVPMATYSGNTVGINVTIIPTVLVAVQLKWRL